MKALLGIDVGTTNIKAIVFNLNGKPISSDFQPSPVTALKEGGGIFKIGSLWKVTARAINRVIRQCEESKGNIEIEGLAIASMAESGVPLDGKGKELYPVILWYDPRTEYLGKWWKKTFSEKSITAITGQRMQHIFSANKIIWLKENEPEIFKRMDKWACISDYLSYKLTGNLFMDYSIASRTMLLDIYKKKWSDVLLHHSGLDPKIMPPLKNGGTIVGKITAEATTITGLRTGTPVFAGGHDHICGALACGVIEDGIILDSCGTAEAILTTVRSKKAFKGLNDLGYSVGFHTARNKFYLYGGLAYSGGTVDWFHDNIYPDVPEKADMVSGSRGLLFLPHLRGSGSPTRNPVSKGAFIGIKSYHKISDFNQAVYEGLAFEARSIMEDILNREKAKRIIMIGGGTHNRQWLQTRADIFSQDIEIPRVQEATSLGAAILAGIGAGIYKDEADAVKRTYKIGRQIKPKKENKEIYERLYEVFVDIYSSLLKINQCLEFFKNSTS